MLNVPAMKRAAAMRRATVVPAWWPDADTLGWWPFGAANSLEDQFGDEDWTAANGAEINDGGGTEVRSVQFVAASSQSLGQENIATSGDAAAMIWIKFATVADAWLFQMRGPASTTWGWQIIRFAAGGGVLGNIRFTDGTNALALIQSTTSAGVWYCYGMTIDNTGKTLTPYLNGQPGTPVSFVGKTPRYDGVMRIGTAGWNTLYVFNGRANDALYVQRAVSTDDHLAFYNGTKAYYGVA